MKLTVSKEDYLKAIVEAELEGEPPIAAAVARRLEVSAAAVTMALGRLRRDGLIESRAEGVVALTEEGRSVADRVRIRHYLIERMLTEVLGLEWFEVHEEAERLEHVISPRVEARLAEMLGTSAPCPHGVTLPMEPVEAKRAAGWTPLTEAPFDVELRVACVGERNRALLEFLDQMEIRPGVALRVGGRNADGTWRVEVGGTWRTVGERGCAQVWVHGIS